MKHILKVTYTCPEGAVTGQQYHVLNQEETEALLSAVRGGKYTYIDATVMGVVEPLGEWLKKGVENILSANNQITNPSPQ
jgi:hypothetical protein